MTPNPTDTFKPNQAAALRATASKPPTGLIPPIPLPINPFGPLETAKDIVTAPFSLASELGKDLLNLIEGPIVKLGLMILLVGAGLSLIVWAIIRLASTSKTVNDAAQLAGTVAKAAA